MSLVQVFLVCSPPGDAKLIRDWLVDEREALRRLDPLPYGHPAGLKAGEAGPEDTVKPAN